MSALFRLVSHRGVRVRPGFGRGLDRSAGGGSPWPALARRAPPVPARLGPQAFNLPATSVRSSFNRACAARRASARSPGPHGAVVASR